MAGVLGAFMRHTKKRQSIARRREYLKTERIEREARSKSGSVDTRGKGVPPRMSGAKPPQVKTNKIPPIKGGKKGKKGHKHQPYELLVNIDLVEYGLSDDMVDDFKEAFMLFDKDDDGIIPTSELGVIMKALGQRPSDYELRKLIEGVETCADGTIEFNEFLQMMSKKLKKTNDKDELKEAFKVFDKKNSGYLSSEELRYVMMSLGEKMSPEEVDDMLKEASPSGDGKVDYEEFATILAKG